MSFLEPYAQFRQRTGIDPLAPADHVMARLAASPFGDATRIDPIPLILSADELDRVAAGTRQRARALQRFFADICCGSGEFPGEFLDQPGGVPSALLDSILSGHGHRRDQLRPCWSGRSRADVCFTYAPDLIHDDCGAWRVLEDNVGCIGGLADSYYCQREYLAAVGLDSESGCADMPDLCRAVRTFLADADARSIAVELGCDGHVDGRPIRESERRAALLRRLGLSTDGSPNPVAVSRIVNFPPARRQCYEAFGRGRAKLLNAPGVEFLGDKRLLPHVEAMVEFYLDEDPLLRSLPTRVLAGANDVVGRQEGVVKRGCGAQGSSVYFLDDVVERGQALRAIAGAEPMSFVIQELAPTAARAGLPAHYRVELRPFAFVLGNRPLLASRIPSSRVPQPSRRRANLSRGGHYAAVLREPPFPPASDD